jgi:hypothetical protein
MEYEYSLPNTVQMTATVVAMQQNFYQQCRYVLYDDAMIPSKQHAFTVAFFSVLCIAFCPLPSILARKGIRNHLPI